MSFDPHTVFPNSVVTALPSTAWEVIHTEESLNRGSRVYAKLIELGWTPPAATVKPQPEVCVSLAHDLEDGYYYYANWPDGLYDSWLQHKKLEVEAARVGCRIVWVGDPRYNPWRQ